MPESARKFNPENNYVAKLSTEMAEPKIEEDELEIIKKALKIEKGSGKNTVSKAGTLSKTQLKEIAERKLPDLNANDVDAAMKIVAGSARSMGIDVK